MTANPIISYEFFPPGDDAGAERLTQVRQQLQPLQPEFISVTYGAGGSTQERTRQAVLDIHRAGVAVAPHLTCVGASEESLSALLDHYRESKINRIVALRGDSPPGAGPAYSGSLRYASDLVAFIRRKYGDYFHLEVAAYPEFHPQAVSPSHDIDYFQRKVEAGANSAITQYFFNADAYFRFIDQCEKRRITIPIIPGIMPIGNYAQLARFSNQCGAEIPRWLALQLAEFKDDTAALRAFGIDVVSRLCAQLLEQGAPGLHFYTMNRSSATLAIAGNLGLLTTAS